MLFLRPDWSSREDQLSGRKIIGCYSVGAHLVLRRSCRGRRARRQVIGALHRPLPPHTCLDTSVRELIEAQAQLTP